MCHFAPTYTDSSNEQNSSTEINWCSFLFQIMLLIEEVFIFAMEEMHKGWRSQKKPAELSLCI